MEFPSDWVAGYSGVMVFKSVGVWECWCSGLGWVSQGLEAVGFGMGLEWSARVRNWRLFGIGVRNCV